MLNFLAENGGTIVIAGVILLLAALAVAKLIRNKQRGETACGCGCVDCPSSSLCHPSEQAGTR